jgi:hypothetical protein
MKHFVILLIMIFNFFYGAAVGRYELPPYSQIQTTKGYLLSFFGKDPDAYLGKGHELLKFAFTDDLIKGDKIYPPINSLEGVRERNEEIFMPAKSFFTSYDDLELTSSSLLYLDNGKTRVSKVSYALEAKQFESYSYGLMEENTEHNKAVLIIPGSMLNQSSAIYNNDPQNYHYGILEALKDTNADIFVYIKPNEDILAFHDGKKKLGINYYVNWHLNRGGSYSASYITQTLAFTKHLKSKYEKVAVIGLSQGGGATLLNVLQSEPDIAVIASGYSVINEIVTGSGFNQIIIPEVDLFLSSERLKEKIQSMNTRFLFTWGNHEEGVYRIEAKEQSSCNKLAFLENVKCMIFNGEHEFPVHEIRKFFK